jgi:hypothetical protein
VPITKSLQMVLFMLFMRDTRGRTGFFSAGRDPRCFVQPIRGDEASVIATRSYSCPRTAPPGYCML